MEPTSPEGTDSFGYTTMAETLIQANLMLDLGVLTGGK